MNAYLSKPFDPEELVSMVDNVIFNHLKAGEVAAAEVRNSARPVPVEQKGSETAETDAGENNGGVLDDVRR